MSNREYDAAFARRKEWADEMNVSRPVILHLPSGLVGRVEGVEYKRVQHTPSLSVETATVRIEGGHEFHAEPANFARLSDVEAKLAGLMGDVLGGTMRELATWAASNSISQEVFERLAMAVMRCQARAMGAR